LGEGEEEENDEESEVNQVMRSNPTKGTGDMN